MRRYAAVMGNLSSAGTEHVKGTPVSVVGNTFSIEVPAGEVRVVAVDHMASELLHTPPTSH
jgi:hypothetical protein